MNYRNIYNATGTSAREVWIPGDSMYLNPMKTKISLPYTVEPGYNDIG
jgi:hypothetical protein